MKVNGNNTSLASWFPGHSKWYYWMYPASLGRKEDADFVGRCQFIWLVKEAASLLSLIHCRVHMEKHTQACWFGWAGLIFPYQQKWNNTLGKWGDNTAVHFSDERLCMPSRHYHLSHSPIPAGERFFLSYRVPLTILPTDTISSQIPPSLQELGHSLELTWAARIKNEARLSENPSHFLCLSATGTRLQQLWALCFSGRWQSETPPPTAQPMSSPCTPALWRRWHCVACDQFAYVPSYPCKSFGSSSSNPYSCCPRMNGLLEMIFWD